MKLGKASSLDLDARAASADLYIYDVIGAGFFGGVSSAEIVKALAEAKGAKTLNVHINSPGGNVFEGVAIYNALKQHPAEKVVYVDGVAASMASLVAMAGDRICTAENAMWMVHEPTVQNVEGTADDLQKMAERVAVIRQMMADTYAKRTGQKPEDIAAWMAAETWMTAQEAKERGFTTEITKDEVRVAAMAGPALAMLAQYKHAPERLLDLATAPTTAGKEAPMADPVIVVSKTLLTHLGLAEAASEAEAVVAVSTLKDVVSQLVALTGKTNPAEALAVAQGWKAGAEQLSAVSARLAELEKAAEARAVDELIAVAKREGRLAPASETAARNVGAKAGVVALKAFLETMPKFAERKEPDEGHRTEEPAPIDVSHIVLTAEERRQAKQAAGSSPKAVADFEAAMLKRKQERALALATTQDAA